MAAYDLVVIGSGAAGATAATTAVHEGASRVAIVEQGPLWGTCVNTGCIPSKFLLALAESSFYRNRGSGDYSVENRFNLLLALAEKEAFITWLRQKKTDRMITGLGIEIIEGSAAFRSPHELEVSGRVVNANRIIIATGSSPQIPPVPGIGSVPYMTNVEALDPERIPDSLIVIGGRALGLEFAQLYAHLGTKVMLLQRSARIIPDEEPEIADLLAGCLRDEGIDIRTGAEVRGVTKTVDGVAVTVSFGGPEQVFRAGKLLAATGRTPNTKDLGLDRAGVKTGPGGAVIVDAALGTSVPGIWAAGDVTGEPMLETAARYAGEIAAQNSFRELQRSFDRRQIPHGIYTMPQVAGVGMTEVHARSAGLDPECRLLRMDELARSWMNGDSRGLVKIVACRKDGCVLGVHVCAPLATEILSAAVLAVNRHLPVDDLAEMYNIFPTTGEAITLCARQFRKNAGSCAI